MAERFDSLLGSLRTELESELAAFLDRKVRSTSVPATRELLEPLREFVLRGGKRLRPALVQFACRAAGGSRQAALEVGLSLELLHTYLLVHDDIMDGAETRRGGVAAHRGFEAAHRERRWRGSAARHGEATAILMGDLAHSYAVELFLAAPIEPQRRSEAASVFAEMCQEVVLGQYLEMTALQRENLGREDLLDILRLKSGRYSVERPLELGAILGAADRELRGGLSRYGTAIGEAFQLQDDLLGVFGDREAVGKPVGGDLAEGKFTLLVLAALELAGDAERRSILACLQDSEPSARRIGEVTRLIETLGARREIERLVGERLDEARRALAALDLDDECRVFFAGLIDYLEGRRA